MQCLVCIKDVHPAIDMLPSGGVVNVCPHCQCVLGNARPEPTTPPQSVEAVLGAATSNVVKLTLKDPGAATRDLVLDAKMRLAVIDGELTRMASLQRERRKLAAMVAAADMADEADPTTDAAAAE